MSKVFLRRCLRFNFAQVGVLDFFRSHWDRRPGVTATLPTI